jgi:putative transcriptional regulator
MEDTNFNALISSIQEAGQILRGEREAQRRFEVQPSEVRQIRKGLEASQPEFAAMMGISVATLRNWEQGRRVPEGPARILLHIAAKRPEVLRQVVEELRAS